MGLVANLPDRCKSVFRARRIHGLSQQETVETLGLTESVVEHEMMKGMRLMSDMIARYGVDQESRDTGIDSKKRAGKRSNVKD
jgi:RNA polymerase sigma-70 factor (ECF subfamily)